MSDNEDKLKYLGDLLKSCLLPELIQELGVEPLESQHFDIFRKNLDVALVQLFDLIHHNEDILYDTENETLLIRRDFILLLCEQTAVGTLYQTKNKLLLDNLRHLTEKHFMKMINNDKLKIFDKLFQYYKERLKTACWKKHFGTVHGFDRFCELYYKHYNNVLSPELCTFVLSVGLLLEEFYDPVYREIAFKIFNIILTAMPLEDIKNINVHNLIYETAFRDITKVTTKEGSAAIWQCLLRCIEIFQIKDFSKWNKVDDLMFALIQRITFESSSETCIELFLIFPKLMVLNSSNKLNLSNLLCTQYFNTFHDNINNLRKECKNLSCPASYRCVKKILELFIAESNRILGNANIAFQILTVIHICFLVLVYSIPAKLAEPQMLEFLKKFPLVLMEALNLNRNDNILKMSVTDFLETLLSYIQDEKYQLQRCEQVGLYQVALKKILCDGII